MNQQLENEQKSGGFREFWLFDGHPAIWGSHLFGAVIALWAPLDTLTQYPFLKQFTLFMNDLFPVVGNYQRKSHFPQVSELYFATMLALGPLWFWRSWVTPEAAIGSNDRVGRTLAAGWPKFIFGLLFWPLLIIGGPFFMLMINPGYQYEPIPFNESRVALAIGGPLFSSSAFFLLGQIKHVFFSFKRAFIDLIN